MAPTLKNWKQKKHFVSIHHHFPKNLSIIYGIFEYCNLIFSSLRVTTITSFCLFTSIDNYSPHIHQKCLLFSVHFLYSISGSLSSKFYDVKTAWAGEKMHIEKTIQKMRKRWTKEKDCLLWNFKILNILKTVYLGNVDFESFCKNHQKCFRGIIYDRD